MALLAALAGLAAPPAHAWQPYDRWIDLQGVDNFRDIGAYDAGSTATVATGLVYRSANLNNSWQNASTLTVTDAGKIKALGVRVIIDLRTPGEVAAQPDSALLDEFTTHVYFPLAFITTETMEYNYGRMVREYGDTWRQIFEILADPTSMPLNYHCQAGKDRTGILTALILMHLGVERDFVEHDYLLSNVAYGYPVVYPNWLEAVFNEVDAAGGIEAYLESIGVTKPVRDAVRENLRRERRSALPRWSLYP